MWIVCLGSLVSLGLVIWILIKQHKCCGSEPYQVYPSIAQAKKILNSPLCKSAACKSFSGGQSQCNMCNMASKVVGCCNCN